MAPGLPINALSFCLCLSVALSHRLSLSVSLMGGKSVINVRAHSGAAAPVQTVLEQCRLMIYEHETWHDYTHTPLSHL